MKAFLKSSIAAGVMALMSICSFAQNFTPVVSPVVHEDNTVTFNYLAPEAENVKLSAQFAPKTDLVKGENGVWSITVGPVTPDIYPYCFEVAWQAIDHGSPRVGPN